MSSRATHESIPGDSKDSLMAAIADEFCERLERGEEPDVEEYARQNPKIAAALRQVLPALKVLRHSDNEPIPPLDEGQTKVTGRLGDFDILREIGRGGMGIVYEADQISLNRKVALKILPFAAALDPTRLERFRYEAQAAARLHHTNIVPVYSVGCERGVYYYAMQFIQGQSLARAIRQWKQSGASGVAGLDFTLSQTGGTITDEPSDRISHSARSAIRGQSGGPGAEATAVPDRSSVAEGKGVGARRGEQETRVEAAVSTLASSGGRRHIETVANMAIQAADALSVAHEMGIVHRDIKPANLLVDMRGHLWVTDFGLARFKNDADLTATGNLVGTLRYMSPEQAVSGFGPVDHRTDIYSLAATVYELLTFEPVIAANTQHEMIEQLRIKEPRSPRKLNPAIPADLETIVLKGLAKDPRDRYESAGAMADDIRRFLQHEPIRAKRPSVVERMVKWSRRHRSLVAAAVVLLVLAVAGLSASLTLLAREQAKTASANLLLTSANERLKSQQQDLEAQRAQLEDALAAEVTASASEAKQRLAAEENFKQAHEMLNYFMEIGEEDMADNPALAPLRSKMLQAGLDYYQRFIEQHESDPRARAKLADSHYHLAQILHETDRTTAATAALEDAARYNEQLAKEFPKDGFYRRRLIRIYWELGILEGRNRMSYLENTKLQAQLKLSDDQRHRLAEILAREGDFYQRILNSSEPIQTRSELQEHNRTTAAAIEQLLDQKQLERFNQICLQQRRLRALTDPEVVAALELTEAQQQEVRTLIQQRMRRGRRDRTRDDGGRDRTPRVRSDAESFAELPRLEDILTPSQAEKWKSMIGEEFTEPLRPRWLRQRPPRDPQRTTADAGGLE